MEFRPLRRKKQELAAEEVEQILDTGEYGVVSVLGDGGYPYGVPVNYVHLDGRVYFHCAKQGHKLDAIASYDQVCFTVVAYAQVQGADYSTDYRSVVVFGRARVVDDADEWLTSLKALGNKYNPDQPQALDEVVRKDGPQTTMVAIDIDHAAGKESIELVMERKKAQASK